MELGNISRVGEPLALRTALAFYVAGALRVLDAVANVVLDAERKCRTLAKVCTPTGLAPGADGRSRIAGRRRPPRTFARARLRDPGTGRGLLRAT